MAITPRKSANTPAQVHGSDVEAQIERIREDIAALTKTVAAYGAGKADKYTAEAEKAGKDILRASHSALENARAEVAAVEKDVEARVRENPLQALGVAVGLGFLLAIIVRH